MKHVRAALVLILCLVLTCTGSVALAANDFTKVPSLKIDVPEKGITSRQSTYLTIDASLPGFLTMKLLDAAGNEVITLANNLEIHSKDNSIEFTAVDAQNKGLAAGTYTLSAQMISQFDVASEPVSKSLLITPPLDEGEDEEPTAPAASNAASDTQASGTQPDAPASSASTETAAPAAPVQEMTYTEGTFTMGEEGLLIGVGVTDVAQQTDAGYWGLTRESTDEEIWAAMIREMPRVNGEETESAYIYDSPEKGRQKLGTVSGVSHGLNVIKERDDGWVLVEAYRNEDGAFVRGYMSAKKISMATPNTDYGLLIDKATQTLTVFKNGQRVGSCAVSTGLPTEKSPQRETPAGEFICVTRRGNTEYYGIGYSKYTIRISGNYYLCELPTTRKNGNDYSVLQSALGSKGTRGNICLPHDASTDGGINAEWIWNMTDESKRVKVLILDDKERSEVPVSE